MLFERLLSPKAAAPYPADHDFWYYPVGQTSSSGFRINTESALRVSTVYACVGLLSDTLGGLPFHIYQRLRDGKAKAPTHPVAQVVGDRPNGWQTPDEWVALMVRLALLRGNGLSRIVPGDRGFVDQLVPWHPDRVVGVEQVRTTGRLIYQHVRDDGREEEVDQDEVFHLRAFSMDGIWGRSVIELARDSIGLALAQEAYASALSGRGAKHGGVLQHPKNLSDDALKHLRASLEEQTTGVGNAGRTLILEEGMTWQQVTMNAQDAQAVDMMKQSANTIAGQWFRVPPHMVGLVDRSTSWGTGIAEQSAGFVRYTLMPWIRLFEGAITRDLILIPQTYYPKFEVGGLLRGTPKERAEFYEIMTRSRIMVPNEPRELEDLDPVPWGDAPLPSPNESVNNRGGGNGNSQQQARMFAEESAGRVVRKEITAIGKAAKRCASDTEAFEAFVREFYADHSAHVADTMKISPDAADAYCRAQCEAVLTGGVAAMSDWKEEVPARLVDQALGVGP